MTIDTVAPAAPGAPDLNAGDDSGRGALDDITNLSTLQFDGSYGGDTDVVSIYSDQEGAGSIGTDSAGGPNYAITAAGLTADVVHMITATYTDLAGNESAASPALSVTIDQTQPAAPSLPDLAAGDDTGRSDEDNITMDDTVGISGTSEALDIIEIYVDGGSEGTTTAVGTDWSFNLDLTAGNGYGEGSYAITADATDVAGNTSATVSSALNITIDQTEPATPGAPDLAAASDSGNSDADDLTNVQTRSSMVRLRLTPSSPCSPISKVAQSAPTTLKSGTAYSVTASTCRKAPMR